MSARPLWYRKAAEQGVAEAQRALGCLYLMGAGVPEDSHEAAMWLRRAAEKGDAEAQQLLREHPELDTQEKSWQRDLRRELESPLLWRVRRFFTGLWAAVEILLGILVIWFLIALFVD